MTTATNTHSTAGAKSADIDPKADLENVKQDLAALKADLATLARDGGTSLKGAAEDQMEAVKTAAYDAADSVRDSALQAGESVSSRVRERPISSVLIAAATGAVLAKIFLR